MSASDDRITELEARVGSLEQLAPAARIARLESQINAANRLCFELDHERETGLVGRTAALEATLQTVQGFAPLAQWLAQLDRAAHEEHAAQAQAARSEEGRQR